MDLLHAIRTRRSIGKVRPDLPPRADIEAMLEAATCAPNHHKVEPWQFIVLSGQGRERLADAWADIEQARHADPASDAAQRAVAGVRAKAYRAPVVIVAIAEPPSHTKIVATENIEAVAAAVQNMLLVAGNRGLGAMWRTGEVAYAPRAKAAFGLSPEHTIVGFIYVGYPAADPSPRSLAPHHTKTTWWGDAEGQYSGTVDG